MKTQLIASTETSRIINVIEIQFIVYFVIEIAYKQARV